MDCSREGIRFRQLSQNEDNKQLLISYAIAKLSLGDFHIWRPQWGAPKSRQKEQNQLIYERDGGGGRVKPEHFADVMYGSPLRMRGGGGVTNKKWRRKEEEKPAQQSLGQFGKHDNLLLYPNPTQSNNHLQELWFASFNGPNISHQSGTHFLHARAGTWK